MEGYNLRLRLIVVKRELEVNIFGDLLKKTITCVRS